jgi:hypothetical protein
VKHASVAADTFVSPGICIDCSAVNEFSASGASCGCLMHASSGHRIKMQNPVGVSTPRATRLGNPAWRRFSKIRQALAPFEESERFLGAMSLHAPSSPVREVLSLGTCMRDQCPAILGIATLEQMCRKRRTVRSGNFYDRFWSC